MIEMRLTWGVIIPTYCRHEVLRKALESVARQTRPPMEVIIIDASPDPEDTGDMVQRDFAERYVDIEWNYQTSKNRSAAIQRNEGIALSSADIVFFIDDDCLMYENYAEIIMDVYEGDKERQLKGVCGFIANMRPDSTEIQDRSITPISIWNRIKRKAYHFINYHLFMNTSKSKFFPYLGKSPLYEMPTLDLSYRIEYATLFASCRATFPRSVISKVLFDGDLLYYSVAEDLDLTYRVSMLGPQAMVYDALIYHDHHPTVRPDVFTITYMGINNLAFFLQKNNPNSIIIKFKFYMKMFSRLRGNFMLDICKRDFSFPRFLGLIWGVPSTIDVFRRRDEGLCAWYREFQKKIYCKKKQ